MRPFLIVVAVLALGACSKQAPTPASRAAVGRADAPTASPMRVSTIPGQRIGGVATLPDRGTLAHYVPNAAVQRDAYTWHPVEISEAHALASIASGELTLTDPEGRPIHLRADRTIEHHDGNWTWVGHRAGDTPGNEAILTFGPTAVFGVIPTAGGDTLRLTTLRGRTWMVETDPAREAAMPKGKWSDDALRVSPDSKGRARVASAGAERATASAAPVTANASAANTVDMVVGYTPSFATRFGGASGANTRLTFMVDVANQAYAASQVDGAMRLVGSVQVNYTVNNSNSDALYAVTGKNCVDTTNGGLSCTDTPVPAELQPLVTARETLGADLVALVRNFDQATQGGCGIAWLIGAEQSSIGPADAEWAYAVVSDSNGEGAPSNGYVCRDETLAHEAGHLMGLQHDRESASGSNNTLEPEEFGRYPYSFGYRGGSAGVYTVMAYFSSGNSKVRVFSNPSVLCAPAGKTPAPCGVVDQADNARALRQTMPIVAAFRAGVAPVTRRFSHDFDGNRRDDLLWYQPDSRELYTWFMSGGVPVIGQTGGYAFLGTEPGAVDDFNGDGYADVFLVGATPTYMYSGNGAGGFNAAYVGSRPAGFQLIGTGDYDADGKPDLFWFNPTNNALQVWRMSGSTIVGTVNAGTVLGGTSPMAIADFGGDGRADILLASASNIYMMVNSAAGYSAAFVTPRPVGWNMLGAADINADMKADVTWYNPTTRELYSWTMNGATPVSGRGGNYAIGGTAPLTVGDYNGDGRADVVLASSANLYMFSGNAAGNYDAAYVAARPGGWRLQ